MTNGLDGDAFWIVTEDGHRANYVRNIEANPRVRGVAVARGAREPLSPWMMDPEARLAKEAQAKSYDARADASFANGSKAGGTGDKYVRDPVFLASVLFLVGISGHFSLRQARYGLIGIRTLILIFAVVQLLGLVLPVGSEFGPIGSDSSRPSPRHPPTGLLTGGPGGHA